MLLQLMRIVANTMSGNVGLKYCSSGNEVAEMAIDMKCSLSTEHKKVKLFDLSKHKQLVDSEIGIKMLPLPC